MKARKHDFWLFLINVAVFVSVSEAQFNLFMNESETHRLLGIQGELYYVRDGIVNDYALSFYQLVKWDVVDLYFNWQSLRQSPQEVPIFYSLSFAISNPQAMLIPSTSIPENGQVPATKSVFRISLHCTGSATAEVDVRIFLNVTMFSASNLTILEIRRKKMCHKGSKNEMIPDKEPDKKNVPGYDHNYSLIDSRNGATSSHVFYIGIGCACGAIIFIALFVLVCYMRTKKIPVEHLSDTSSGSALSRSEHAYLKVDTLSRSSVSGAAVSVRRGTTPVSYSELKPSEVRAYLQDVMLDISCISLHDVIMEGTFGQVYVGTLVTSSLESDCQQVVVKTVTDQARPDQVDIMLREGSVMKEMSHDNINSLLAVCYEHENKPLLIYSFMNEGNLKKFLHRCRISDIGYHQAINTQQLVYIAIQISRAVLYLHKKQMIHRDISTRNCVINNRLAVKVTDTALSRDLFPHDYHCLGDNENRPIKWLSLEALLHRRFSVASDSWSFGVLLWELMTLGQQPYADIDPFEMATYLQAGYRVSQPINCPNELFAIMACCWSVCPDERPKFTQLQLYLQDFYKELSQFV